MTAKPAFRVDTIRKLLKLAEEFQLDEISYGGLYAKRGGPLKGEKAEKAASSKGKEAKARNQDDDLADIDSANEPIMDAYRQELGGN